MRNQYGFQIVWSADAKLSWDRFYYEQAQGMTANARERSRAALIKALQSAIDDAKAALVAGEAKQEEADQRVAELEAEIATLAPASSSDSAAAAAAGAGADTSASSSGLRPRRAVKPSRVITEALDYGDLFGAVLGRTGGSLRGKRATTVTYDDEPEGDEEDPEQMLQDDPALFGKKVKGRGKGKKGQGAAGGRKRKSASSEAAGGDGNE